MSEPKYNNSASRLLAALEVITNGGPMWTQVVQLGFAQSVPNAEAERSRVAFQAMVEIHQLYIQFKEDIADSDLNKNQQDEILVGLAKLDRIIFAPIVSQALSKLEASEVILLKVAAASLTSEETIANDDLEAIRASIAELQKQVEDSEISPTLRKILLELIRLSQDAIARYKINGALGLKKAFKGMLAEVTELYNLDKKEQEDIKKTQGWKKLMEHLGLFDNLTGKLMKYQPILEKGWPLLFGPS